MAPPQTRADEDTVVSVVIPYSPEHTPEPMLWEAEASARNQTVPVDILTVVDEDQRGPAWARNEGLERADTRYVAFLDADDLWVNDKLERQLDRMKATGAGLCVEGQSMSVAAFVEGLVGGTFDALTPSVVADTDRVTVRFDETLDRREDHLFMIRAAEQAGVCFCSELVEVRKHDEGLSARNTHDLRERTTEQFADRLRSETETGYLYLDVLYADYHHRRGRAAHRDGDYSTASRAFISSLRRRARVKTFAALCLSIAAHVRTNSLPT